MQHKFKKGDMVETPLGLFEVLDSNESNFLSYKEGFDGHSGYEYFGDKYLRTEYKDQCWWFKEDELKVRYFGTKKNLLMIFKGDLV